MFKQKVLPTLIWLFYWLWSRSWRLTVVEDPATTKHFKEGRKGVVAFWHGDELAVLRLSSIHKVATMTSTSKDGDLLDRVVQKLNVKTARGSSTRGGATALMGLVKLARDGRLPVVSVDGPKGPYHKAKPGIFQISKELEGAILPLGFAARRSFIFQKAWNKAALPYPFTKVVLYWGSPLPIVKAEQDPRAPELARNLETALDAASRQASNVMDSVKPEC